MINTHNATIRAFPIKHEFTTLKNVMLGELFLSRVTDVAAPQHKHAGMSSGNSDTSRATRAHRMNEATTYYECANVRAGHC
jgi:hypothetical protein